MAQHDINKQFYSFNFKHIQYMLQSLPVKNTSENMYIMKLLCTCDEENIYVT